MPWDVYEEERASERSRPGNVPGIRVAQGCLGLRRVSGTGTCDVEQDSYLRESCAWIRASISRHSQAVRDAPLYD